MTIELYALENTRARLCAKQARLSDAATADLVQAAWEAEGFIVNRVEEE